jgi:hypothetical protein
VTMRFDPASSAHTIAQVNFLVALGQTNAHTHVSAILKWCTSFRQLETRCPE